MKIKQTIGIDISKLTFDVRVHSNQMYLVLDNKPDGFKKLIKWVNKHNTFAESETLYIFEHTGLYSHQLAVFLTEQNIPFALVPGLEVKRTGDDLAKSIMDFFDKGFTIEGCSHCSTNTNILKKFRVLPQIPTQIII